MLFRLFIFAFFITCLPIVGQQLLPPIQNYQLLDYKGGSKNWDVSVNENGELFAANNKGLLHFNGEEWTLNKLPNNTIIRSVESIGDRVYTGSYEEFGYWTKNEFGELEYTSLTHLIQDHTFTSEEFWEIFPSKDGEVMFRSFSAIYSYANDQIKVIDPDYVVSDFVEFNGKLIVAAGSTGLYEVVGETSVPFPNQDLLKGKTVNDMAVYKGQLLIGTKLHGCFVFDGNSLTPWSSPVNEALKQHQLNKITLLGNGMLGFGTIKNGMYLYDSTTEQYRILNRESGLQNNTVLSTLLFKNQLWLGLDNGIARVRINNPISYYTDYTGTLGMVYDIAWYNGKLFLGSNTGVFYFEGNQLQFVDGSQGHVWDLQVVEGDLLCGHNTGTYKVTEDSFEQVSEIAGGYQIIKVPGQNAAYVQGTYNGLAKFQKLENGEWNVNKIQGFDAPVKQLCFETPELLWVAHPYKGFSRLHLSEGGYQEFDKIQEFEHEGAPSEYNVKLYNIKNTIVLNSEGNWFSYNPIGDRIEKFDEFTTYENKELLFFDDEYFWFVDEEDEKAIIHTNLKGDSLLITDLPLRERLAPDSQSVVQINDSTSYITLTDGFAKINDPRLKQITNEELPVPQIVVLYDEDRKHSVLEESIKIPFRHSESITIEVAASEYISPHYYYQLQGPKEYAQYADNGFINFQNLPFGDYTLRIATAGMENSISDYNSLSFTIAPPWYFSWGSLVFYLALGVLAIYLVRRYNRRKLERKQRELEEHMRQEQLERMAKLEKEELAKQVRLKQNELASTTLNIARKNEMILELKNMLVMNKEKFSNSQRYRSFIKQLNNSIEDTEDWKRFEVNFKELHEDFFERLLKSFPSLTPKDLKLCAYLKMNLSTKEIAPLMGITIRGVEIHRYRLRKKLDMDSSENLSNFLITF
ncbi:Two component regulator three Y domain-containing protein [Flagellimonas zhangzhouensis]|uniref:DNA-binding transcriptional regulator, CsgD family n=1 Tax=Flagellimonas zhangzhouensis TaxID=1073328 RepID=A0A1H2RHU8_9FLAO|nr:Two component regulator three Y domain-containing protein [Allomuricauda zhangzhouensis]SDQ63783.1 DNA-binding transcriptional regulator, CsgD family [Allomuricauda zhangzhouensis]SDW18750.1 DNA-binding transcriptional regulator, CsgD family [Allomuricauda zhangzhouensis]